MRPADFSDKSTIALTFIHPSFTCRFTPLGWAAPVRLHCPSLPGGTRGSGRTMNSRESITTNHHPPSLTLSFFLPNKNSEILAQSIARSPTTYVIIHDVSRQFTISDRNMCSPNESGPASLSPPYLNTTKPTSPASVGLKPKQMQQPNELHICTALWSLSLSVQNRQHPTAKA